MQDLHSIHAPTKTHHNKRVRLRSTLKSCYLMGSSASSNCLMFSISLHPMLKEIELMS